MAWKERPLKRSYACAPDLLAFLRERQGLTQKQLAETAGYSERLVSKAEAGRPISAGAINDLAEALSTSDALVYPEDLIVDPVQIAKEFIKALYTKGKGIIEAIRHFLDDEVVFHLVGDPEQLPIAGRHEGIAAVERLFDIFFSIFEVPKDHDFESCYTYLGQGNEVRVWGDNYIHPIGKPMDVPLRMANRLVFRRGKMILYEDTYDTLMGIDRLSE